MAAVLIADVGAVNANSFATVAFADAYNATVLNSEAWDDADSDQKVRALISATRDLTNMVRWYGRAASDVQALPFPRIWLLSRNGYFIPSDIIPVELQNATAELARRKIESGSTPAAGDDTLKSLKAGPVNLVFNNDAIVNTGGLPTEVFQMIAHLAETSAGGGIRSVGIVRV